MFRQAIVVFLTSILVSLNSVESTLPSTVVRHDVIYSDESKHGDGSYDVKPHRQLAAVLYVPYSSKENYNQFSSQSEGRHPKALPGSEITCYKSDMQCVVNTSILLECSESLDIINIWNCKDIFPSEQFGNAQALNILCDVKENSCMAFIEVLNVTDENSTTENHSNSDNVVDEDEIIHPGFKNDTADMTEYSVTQDEDLNNFNFSFDKNQMSHENHLSSLVNDYQTENTRYADNPTTILNFDSSEQFDDQYNPVSDDSHTHLLDSSIPTTESEVIVFDKMNNSVPEEVNFLENNLTNYINDSYMWDSYHLNNSADEDKIEIHQAQNGTANDNDHLILHYLNEEAVSDIQDSTLNTTQPSLHNDHLLTDMLDVAEEKNDSSITSDDNHYDNKIYSSEETDIFSNENIPAISDNSNSEVISLYARCKSLGPQCADDKTLIICDELFEEPAFEMSCSSMLVSSDTKTFGFCDRDMSTCKLLYNESIFLVNVSEYKPAVNMSPQFIDSCAQGGLVCADNVTLVACSGDSAIQNYAISCSVENDDFVSYCDYKQNGCYISPRNDKFSHVADPLFGSSPSVNIHPEVISHNSTEANHVMQSLFSFVCKIRGWQCIKSDIVMFCSSELEMKSLIFCDTVKHPYCDSSSDKCILGEAAVEDLFEDSCKKAGYMCLDNNTLAECSDSLEFKSISQCNDTTQFCNKDSATCETLKSEQSISDLSNMHNSLPTTMKTKSQEEAELFSPVDGGSLLFNSVANKNPLDVYVCRKHGVQCISETMLGVCSLNNTLTYTVSCRTLLPFVSDSDYIIYCAEEYDSCAVSLRDSNT